MTATTTDSVVSSDVSQWLYREARLLDTRRYDEWCDLLADDLRYSIPIRHNRFVAEGDSWDVDAELTTDAEYGYMNDDKGTMSGRVFRLQHTLAHAENPPSRTARVVSNVEVEPAETEGEYRVHSVLVLHRSHGEARRDTLACRRTDVLRRVGAGFELARRRVILIDAILGLPNLSSLL